MSFFSPEVILVVPQFVLYVGELRVKPVIFKGFRLVQVFVLCHEYNIADLLKILRWAKNKDRREMRVR